MKIALYVTRYLSCDQLLQFDALKGNARTNSTRNFARYSPAERLLRKLK